MTFHMVAKTFGGLEEVLRDELIALGAKNVEIGLRMVEFDGDLEMMYKANLCLRTALRILKPIYSFEASDPDELYDAVREMNWEDYLTPDSTFAIDSTVHSSEFRHSKYVTYRVKDGIVDHFNDSVGRRPSIRLVGADLMLNVHISETRVTISLDSSGEPLSKRGYRKDQTQAPLNEALAAGLILKTGWRGDCPLLDPMCGSGTFLIEAALIAANINPGIYRQGFAFEKWPDFDAELFERLYNDDSGERQPAHPIMGGDIDAEAVSIARKNIASARVGNFVEVRWQSFTDWKGEDVAKESLPIIDESEPQSFEEPQFTGGMLITNPPYGERLKLDKIEELYRQIGECLKKNFRGWHAWILGYKPELFDAIRLKSSMRYPILNGALECSFREYVMFDGRYNDFRAAGGEIKEKREEPEVRKRPFANRKNEGRSIGTRNAIKERYRLEEDRPFRKKDFKERSDKSKPAEKGFKKFEGKGFKKFEGKDFRKSDGRNRPPGRMSGFGGQKPKPKSPKK